MRHLLILVFMTYCIVVKSQQPDSIRLANRFSIQGYVKQLSVIAFNKNFTRSNSNNFLHHRMNINYLPADEIKCVAELRNRFFWSDSIRFLGRLERLSAEFSKSKWNIRIGRQRVNWSMATTWNPNDLFNAYNFLDFDYEERPGIDGFRIQYSISDLSDLQMVYARIAGRKDVFAARYFFNRSRYDIQATVAWYSGRPALGMGWAGQIQNSGFRGEVQYYFNSATYPSRLNATAEIDHVFAPGWYLNYGMLYNNRGLNQPVADFKEVDLNISSENLMPGRWSSTVGLRKEISPLWSFHCTSVYSPGMNLLILIGSTKYSLSTDLEVDLTGQSFYATTASAFQAVQHVFFLRLRWSY